MEHVVTGGFNAIEKPLVDPAHDLGSQDPSRIEGRRFALRRGEEVPGARHLKPHQVAERRIPLPARERFLRVSEPPHIFAREIDPPARHVRAEIAQDVRELKRHSQILGVRSAALLLVPEDAQADEADHRGHAVAVATKLLESTVAKLRQIHLDAREKLVQVDARDPETQEMRLERPGRGLDRLSLVAGGDFTPPAKDLLPRQALVGRFIHTVVDRAAECVHGADRLPLVGRERAEGEREVRSARGRARISHRAPRGRGSRSRFEPYYSGSASARARATPCARPHGESRALRRWSRGGGAREARESGA